LWLDHGLVFTSGIGTPVDLSNLCHIFARITKRAGLTERFPYLMRHAAVSLLIDAGAGIEEVPDLLRRPAPLAFPLVSPVGVEGFEPPTSCASCMRSNQLSYTPKAADDFIMPRL
jgi:hypothetical protein